MSHESKYRRAQTRDEGQEQERGVRLDSMTSVLDRLARQVGTLLLLIDLVAPTVDDIVAGKLASNL